MIVHICTCTKVSIRREQNGLSLNVKHLDLFKDNASYYNHWREGERELGISTV